MFKITFSCILLALFLVSLAEAQKELRSAVERREEREAYNQKIDDPSLNPYKRDDSATDRTTPGQIPKGKLLKLQPPPRTILDTEISEILDGDTVAIRNAKNQRVVIRLLGIDAPEIDQEFGRQAMENLAEKLKGKKVRLAFEPRGVPDEQGRVLAKIMVNDVDISVDQVREGFAWYYEDHKERLGFLEIDELKQLQSAAKKQKLQLWQNNSAQAPWKFRKKTA
jgi:endonuclease YncB( thermonuclease family)